MPSPCRQQRLPGRKRARHASPWPVRTLRGFTLMEIVVVVAIIGIGAGMVALSWPDSRLRALEREGDRLAALLETARVHSRASGQPLRWRTLEDGFVFEGNAPHLLPRLPTHWEAQGVVALSPQPVVLGPEPLLPPQTVVLTHASRPELRVHVGSDGLQPFRVLAP